MNVLSESGLGALCATGSALTWAVIGLLVRSLSTSFNSVTLNAVRSALGAVLILGWVLVTTGPSGLSAISGKNLALLAISVVVAVGIGDTAFFESSRALGLAHAMTLSMSYPLLAALLAGVFLDEQLTARLAIGSVLTLSGLALTVTAPTRARGAAPDRFWLGMGTASLASLAWAVSVILLKPSLGDVDAVHAQAVRLPVAALMLWVTPWAWGVAEPVRRHGASAVWRLLALGALTAISSVMFAAGVRHVGVAVATVLSSTAPVFAVPLGLVFLGERLAPTAVIGTVVAVIGIGVLRA